MKMDSLQLQHSVRAMIFAFTKNVTHKFTDIFPIFFHGRIRAAYEYRLDTFDSSHDSDQEIIKRSSGNKNMKFEKEVSVPVR
jgi:hypothetical protein